jgi:hypothetical protein
MLNHRFTCINLHCQRSINPFHTVSIELIRVIRLASYSGLQYRLSISHALVVRINVTSISDLAPENPHKSAKIKPILHGTVMCKTSVPNVKTLFCHLTLGLRPLMYVPPTRDAHRGETCLRSYKYDYELHIPEALSISYPA